MNWYKEATQQENIKLALDWGRFFKQMGITVAVAASLMPFLRQQGITPDNAAKELSKPANIAVLKEQVPDQEKAKKLIQNMSNTEAQPTTRPVNISSEARVKAFLDMIGYSEGANYDTLVGGKEKITDFSHHPNKKVLVRKGLVSTAAGKYQILKRTWDELGMKDFSPASQDQAAIKLLQRRGALDLVKAGKIEEAIEKCNKEWASFPNSPYGQGGKTIEDLLKVYNKSLEKYSNVNKATPTTQRGKSS